MVPAVCHKLGIHVIYMVYILLYATVVGNDCIGKLDCHTFRETQVLLYPAFPFCTAVFQSVNVDYHSLVAEKLE